MDVTKVTFQPENALEEALLSAYESNDLDLLLPTLAIADVYVPTAAAPAEDQRVTARDGDEIPLPVVEADDGARLVPIFSSLTQLGRFRAGHRGYMRLQGRALAAITPSDLGIALNPGGELGLPLPPEEVTRLAVVPPPDGDTEFLIGEPREEPVELLETIRRFAVARPEIRAAYRGLLISRPGAHPEHVIGLELVAGADAKAVIDAATEAARGAGVDRLGLLPLQPGLEGGGQVGRFLLSKTKPFWSRDMTT